MKVITYEELSVKERELVEKAEEAMKLSYNPYGSEQKVGAAVRSPNGRIIKGGNFGNAFNIVDICAERSVMVTANNLGERVFHELAIIRSSENKECSEPILPCGVCRQALLEVTRISGQDLLIYGANSDKSRIAITSLYDLLPHAYKR